MISFRKFSINTNPQAKFKQSRLLIKATPGGSDGKESACNAGGPGSIPRLGRSSGEGNGNPLQWIEESGGLQSMGSQRVRHN